MQSGTSWQQQVLCPCAEPRDGHPASLRIRDASAYNEKQESDCNQQQQASADNEKQESDCNHQQQASAYIERQESDCNQQQQASVRMCVCCDVLICCLEQRRAQRRFETPRFGMVLISNWIFTAPHAV
ncbi:hypothetical protein CLOP_g13761 [Closterium sp. NIES-67]|nr:hypothetical protein CLOP_g13761 [Closterium sp. NIES-67]